MNGKRSAAVRPRGLAWFAAVAATAVIASTASIGLGLVGAPVQAQQAVRPDLGRPLQAAQQLIRAQRFKEALAKVREADAVGAKTANETFLIERMRLAAASGAGELETAARSFEAVSEKVSSAERLQMIESLAGGYYRAKDYPQAVRWGERYFREGGQGAAMRTLLTQGRYLAGDFAGAADELTTEIRQAERSGSVPAEDRLQLLANAALKANRTDGHVWALERLVAHHPKPDYWVELLSGLQHKPGFSDRLALDAYRLSLATGGMTTANDYLEMAQLALQAGLSAEAVQVVEKGFAAKVLGTGAQAERHSRLATLAARRLEEDRRNRSAAIEQAKQARDGTALVNVGMNLVFDGEPQQGLSLMRQGIARGGLRRADDARLHYAVAQIVAGEGAKAQATLDSVAGRDGGADLARLWSLHAKTK